ncbi:YheC/YheD family protein [Caldibacillus lycopersici]|uniref:YheC/YheD family protein n=1 Tax=Perspicuibacillus lycopersici TaxID=1325689 RepID=A0AAE3IQ73_9BACI|nr:YheC/YheD family protein [Perspicuibacillus lycopersici]MCU9612533.1 YheC/YheD family protein [Perspicuibacillus lycopersici]
MQSFGIISINNTSELEYINEIAAYAVKSGFHCYRFTPDAVTPNKDTVPGLAFDSESGEWISAEFPIPTVLYDRCFYRNEQELKQYSPIINWLKTRTDLLFLGYGLPNKLAIYDTLKTNPQILPYLPETTATQHVQEVFKLLRERESLLLKPVFGSQGRGIFVLQKKEKQILVKTVKNTTIIEREMDSEKTKKWLNQLLASYSYLAQPFLSLTNAKQQPFDIRILLQKDENGKWIERGKGMRIGKEQSIISNLAGGGIPYSFEDWLEEVAPEKQEFIQAELNELIQLIPTALEHYYHPLFEIGLDIGIDKRGALWLLEVNSKPGRNVLLTVKPEMEKIIYEAPIKYAIHLLKGISKGERIDGEVLSN